MATGWQMKALFLLALMMGVASVAAYGYASGDVTAGMAALVSHPSQADEPIALLLSGSALIALAGALRRLAV